MDLHDTELILDDANVKELQARFLAQTRPARNAAAPSATKAKPPEPATLMPTPTDLTRIHQAAHPLALLQSLVEQQFGGLDTSAKTDPHKFIQHLTADPAKIVDIFLSLAKTLHDAHKACRDHASIHRTQEAVAEGDQATPQDGKR
jgi:hypothetical protein